MLYKLLTFFVKKFKFFLLKKNHIKKYFWSEKVKKNYDENGL